MNTKQLRLAYTALSALLLIALVLLEGTTGFLRGTVGDVVVVIFLWSLARIVKPTGWRWIPLAIFAFACSVECLQAVNILGILGITNKTAQIAVGSVFDWMDIVAYAVGCAVAAWSDAVIAQKVKKEARAIPKLLKITLISLTIAIVLLFTYIAIGVLAFAGAFNFLDPREVATYTSPDGEYSLEFEQMGDPAWPYGPTDVRLTLRNQEGRKIGRVSANVYNDGTDATERNIISISWNEDSVTVVLRNQEGGREQEVSIPYG